MVKITEIIIEDNPKLSVSVAQVLSDALLAYAEAKENVAKNGTIVAHPRTGAPLENPYNKIMNQKAAIISRFDYVKTGRAFEQLSSTFPSLTS